jgi:arabinogalactan oligomer/maltooligosaccharide transport system permease protein
MVLTLISVSFTAYAFSRFRFKGRQNGLMLFLLLQMIPQFSALIAIFVLSQLLGLINSHLALVLIYVGDDPDEYLADEGVSRRDPQRSG